MTTPESDSRFPYTYAADYVRNLAGYGERGTKLTRSDASRVRIGIAEALDMPDEELAKKLATYYKQHEDSLSSKAAIEFFSQFK